MEINDVITFLKTYDGAPLNIMEVCGTHTASIAKNGIESILSGKIHLISGPGCPVCVTVSEYIDRLCALSRQENTAVVTFSDMLRVKGSEESLASAKAAGGEVIAVYSPFDILPLAAKEKGKTFIFAAVGFETTTPGYASLAKRITDEGIENIKFLTSLKTMPAAIRQICLMSPEISGFIAPGHVSVITGADAFKPLAEEFSKPFVVSGFSADEILASLYLLVKEQGKGVVKNLYKSAVKATPNEKAAALTAEFFESGTAAWRGLGEIEGSGVYFKEKYARLDAGSRNLVHDASEKQGCRCGDVLTGKIKSDECALFGKKCTPTTPFGACMVSAEGACYNRYINM